MTRADRLSNSMAMVVLWIHVAEKKEEEEGTRR